MIKVEIILDEGIYYIVTDKEVMTVNDYSSDYIGYDLEQKLLIAFGKKQREDHV